MFLTAGLSAQGKPFQFGFHLGPNLSWVKPESDGFSRDGMKIGFDWGIVGEFNILDNYAFTTGFNVNFMYGDYVFPSFTEAGNAVEVHRSVKAKYIEIPLILKMRTNELNNFGLRIYGEVGYGFGIKMSVNADDNYYVGNTQVDNTDLRDPDEEFKTIRSALILGAGVEIPLGGSTFIVAGIQFNNNFNNILKEVVVNNEDFEQKAIVNFLGLKLGLMF